MIQTQEQNSFKLKNCLQLSVLLRFFFLSLYQLLYKHCDSSVLSLTFFCEMKYARETVECDFCDGKSVGYEKETSTSNINLEKKKKEEVAKRNIKHTQPL